MHITYAGLGCFLLVGYSAASQILSLSFAFEFDTDLRIVPGYTLTSAFVQLLVCVLQTLVPDHYIYISLWVQAAAYFLLACFAVVEGPCKELTSVNAWLFWSNLAVCWAALCSVIKAPHFVDHVVSYFGYGWLVLAGATVAWYYGKAIWEFGKRCSKHADPPPPPPSV